MEEPNVNNLNGVPNFGHGFQSEEVEEIGTPMTEEEAEPIEEKVDTPEEITSEETE